MSNKEKCLLFCRRVETHSIDYLEQALHNERILMRDVIEYQKLEGCPTSFGLKNAKWFCENREYELMCVDCWRDALK